MLCIYVKYIFSIYNEDEKTDFSIYCVYVKMDFNVYNEYEKTLYSHHPLSNRNGKSNPNR